MSAPRTALVTGASAGIGAAVAKRLAAGGTEVALCARRTDALAEVRDAIVADGGRARVYELDVTDPTRVYDVLQRADDDLEGIDLVIANAGVARGRWSGKLRWSDVAPILEVNVIGATATLTALLPRMVGRERGHLVGISSLAAYRGLAKQATYSASKAYLSTFLEGLRVDLRTTRISVTDIRPGFVETALTAGGKSMPFMVDVETAAKEIVGAIHSRKSVHAFPLPTATLMRSVSTLPNVLYDRIANKIS
jgi:short-subunit dehydrogenase